MPENLVRNSVYSIEGILKLEQQCNDAVPDVKIRLSKYIERGKIAKEYRLVSGFKCQLCEAVGLNPIGFSKMDGVPQIETHHVGSVAKLLGGIIRMVFIIIM